MAFSRLFSSGSTAMRFLAPGEAGALDGVDADAADAEDDDRLAGLDVGGVDRRAPPGGHAAADEHGLVQRQVVVDLDHGGLVIVAHWLNVPIMHMAP